MVSFIKPWKPPFLGNRKMFISTWKTDNPGTSNSTSITLPLDAGGTYDFWVAWGDGTRSHITAWNQAEVTHDYGTAGTYTVRIWGACPYLSFYGGGDRLKLVNISRFGCLENIDINGLLSDCPNLDISALYPGYYVLSSPEISTGNTVAGVDNISQFSELVDDMNILSIYDSAGKLISGIISSAGTGGAELIAGMINNPPELYPYETFTVDGKNILSAINTADYGICNQAIAMVTGDILAFRRNYTLNSGTHPLYVASNSEYGDGSSTVFANADTPQGEFIAYKKLTGNNQYFGIYASAACDFSDIGLSLKRFPSSTGRVIKNNLGAQSFIFVESGFDTSESTYRTIVRNISDYYFVAILGDSTSAAYIDQNSIARTLQSIVSSEYKVVDLSYPGSTIDGMTAAWTADANKGAYDLINVMIGLNDLNPSESAADAIVRYQTFITTINSNKKTGAKLLLSAMTPCKQRLIDVYGAGLGATAYQKWLDINIAIMGGGLTPVTGADLSINGHTAALNDGSGNLLSIYEIVGATDHIHENNLGRYVIAGYVKSAIATLGY